MGDDEEDDRAFLDGEVVEGDEERELDGGMIRGFDGRDFERDDFDGETTPSAAAALVDDGRRIEVFDK